MDRVSTSSAIGQTKSLAAKAIEPSFHELNTSVSIFTEETSRFITFSHGCKNKLIIRRIPLMISTAGTPISEDILSKELMEMKDVLSNVIVAHAQAAANLVEKISNLIEIHKDGLSLAEVSGLEKFYPQLINKYLIPTINKLLTQEDLQERKFLTILKEAKQLILRSLQKSIAHFQLQTAIQLQITRLAADLAPIVSTTITETRMVVYVPRYTATTRTNAVLADEATLAPSIIAAPKTPLEIAIMHAHEALINDIQALKQAIEENSAVDATIGHDSLALITIAINLASANSDMLALAKCKIFFADHHCQILAESYKFSNYPLTIQHYIHATTALKDAAQILKKISPTEENSSKLDGISKNIDIFLNSILSTITLWQDFLQKKVNEHTRFVEERKLDGSWYRKSHGGTIPVAPSPKTQEARDSQIALLLITTAKEEITATQQCLLKTETIGLK